MFSSIFDDASIRECSASWLTDYDNRSIHSKSTRSSLEYVVTHVFFHPNHPRSAEDPMTHDHLLARAVCVAADAFREYIDPTDQPHWDHIAKMLENLEAVAQSWRLDGNLLISQLGGMRSGDILAFPIQSQNTGVIFRKEDHRTLYEPFDVLQYFEKDAREKVICSYPELTIEIPNEIFDDEHFQSELASFLVRMSEADASGRWSESGSWRSDSFYGQWYDAGSLLGHRRRRGPTHLYTTELLAGILRSVGRVLETSHITKHLGHEIGHLPTLSSSTGTRSTWSRSPLWSFIRVAIQSSHGRSPLGRAAYKVFILFFMSTLADHAARTSLSSDLLHLASSKILRRLRKLGPTAPKWISDVVLQTCTRLSETLDDRLKQTRATMSTSAPWNPSQLDITGDIRVLFRCPDGHLSCPLSFCNGISFPVHLIPDHFRGTLHDFLSFEGSFFEEAHCDSPHITLYDVERAVEVGIDDWISRVANVHDACVHLETLADKYLSSAQDTYKISLDRDPRDEPIHNPDHLSIMLLTIIELWVALDKLTTKEIPILVDYSPEVPMDLLDRLVLHDAGSRERVRRASQYISARHTRAHPGWSVFSHEFTDRSFPVRYYDSSSYLQDLRARIKGDALPTSPLHAKVFAFELQCPVVFDAWRSATSRLFGGRLDPHPNSVAVADIPEFYPYFVAHKRSLVRLLCGPQRWEGLHYTISSARIPELSPQDFSYMLPRGPYASSMLQQYLDTTTHTSNEVLSHQANCHGDLSFEELIAFGHLRSGGSLQWLNILQEMRRKTLNFRRHEVYLLLLQASGQLGPLSGTGELLWHQELEDVSFCHALLDELESLFVDVGAGSLDGPAMSIISLFTCLLASNLDEDISNKAITLLRNVRRKTFGWVYELLYNVVKSPLKEERRELLRDMAVICRSTFNVGVTSIPKLLHSAQDIEIALSCAILTWMNAPTDVSKIPTFSRVLIQRDFRISLALEGLLKDAIQADVSNLGIDCAVQRAWIGYRPGLRGWEPLEYPNSHWFVCETAAGEDRRIQTVHFNLLNGSLLVDGKPVGDRLPSTIVEHSVYSLLFGDQNFLVVPSDLSGMDFVTQFMISDHHVHFSLRGDVLFIRAQRKDTTAILELVSQGELEGVLPAILVEGYAHWLNLSTSIIEIRPLEKLWEESPENWRVHRTPASAAESGQYHITKGREFLLGIETSTWKMVSERLKCLDIAENLLITASPVDGDQASPSEPLQLSIALPRFGLSFFINERGDLESRDFKGMIYDENQCIGTLFSLVNKLVLCPKVQPAQHLIPRCVIIPEGDLRLQKQDHGLHITIDTLNQRKLEHGWGSMVESFYPCPRRPVAYHTYKVDSELGCLTGMGLTSRLYLARLHALTGVVCRPDPLTGRTGLEEAISLIWTAGTRQCNEEWSWQSPQMRTAVAKIRGKGGGDEAERLAYAMLQEAYMFPSEVSAQLPRKEYKVMPIRQGPTDKEDVAYTAASAVNHWSLSAPTVSDLSSWAEAWGDSALVGDTLTSQLEELRLKPDIPQLRIETYSILARGEGPSRRFRLLFYIPTMVCSSSKSYPATLLSTLLVFARQPHMCLEYEFSWAEHIPSDGYYPHAQLLHRIIQDTRRSESTSQEDAIVKQLLESWPSETVPSLSLDPTLYDVAGLTTSLQSFFSSCYRNLKLKEYFQCVWANHSSPSPPSPISEASIPKSPDYMPEPSAPWKVTLDRLLAERRPPKLPTRHTLPRSIDQNRGVSPPDRDTVPSESGLSQLFSSLKIDNAAPPFQHQYFARLLASARHFRTAERPGFTRGGTGELEPAFQSLREHYTKCRLDYVKGVENIKETLRPGNRTEEILERSGQWPRVTPYTLLRCLASTSPIEPPEDWKQCLVSLAFLALELQRARRLVLFAMDKLDEEFFKELENQVDETVAEHPDWLLIQLQGNFLVRRLQLDVAKEMISPGSKDNTVMQVNMGEGKSSVIIPICATALADGRRLVRVIVPKALKAQVLHLLINRLGGLVNRPIYHLTFSRHDNDWQIGHLNRLVSECIEERGILVMQPEHALSLKLASVEMQLLKDDIGAKPSRIVQRWGDEHVLTHWSPNSVTKSTYVGTVFESVAKHLRGPAIKSNKQANTKGDRERQDTIRKTEATMKLHMLVDSCVRDLLDESDEVLHPRFQLIYAMGLQQHMECFPDRWTITQQVLKFTKVHASSLSTLIPHIMKAEIGSSGSFPHIRVLHTDGGERLTRLIAEDVIQGRLSHFSFQYLPTDLKNAVYDFISRKDVSKETVQTVEEYSKQSTAWGVLLLLRGLLANNILLFSLLERRWRVDYGLHLDRTLLAVPYRAKDVPAETAEFGHPDITIVLTCLSYYYSGLSEEQLRMSFEILLDQDDPSSHYADWLEHCASQSVPDSLRSLHGINIRSSEQWDSHIVPLFSRNQGAIDYYLSRVVFPRHAKEFPWKISGSSWDIAEKKNEFVTGFSGTSDSQYLLPTSIHQNDPDHLHQAGASAMVLSYLLQEENNSYLLTAHENGERWTTHEFLKNMVSQKPEIRVLLDVGAQILDLSNRQLAEAWINLCPDAPGAVYFDEDDELMVLARNGATQSLLSSPLIQRLDQCIAYLDDAHTRGTDIKFPQGLRAAVTLGPKVTKDRLVQGCMRMRKLGHGHSVMFFAPLEVDRRIRSVAGKEDMSREPKITTTDILHWAIRETWADIQRRAPYWAQQGMNHISQHEAWQCFCRSELTTEQLTNVWLRPEVKSLSDLYAPHNSLAIPSSTLLDRAIRQRCELLGVSSLPDVSAMDETREREVSREIEREREVERPPEALPATHSLHADVLNFIRTGTIPSAFTSIAFRHVFASLTNSSATTSEAHVWSPHILATADFCDTIVQGGSFQGRVDDYLRPVQWVISARTDHTNVLVLLSPFEVDVLMPDIRCSEHVQLHLYIPRTTKRMRACDDLRLYSIPATPSEWTPPWVLTDQLNMFAGQLYLRDHPSYIRLCRFLGLHPKGLPENVPPTGVLPIRRGPRRFHVPGSFDAEIDLEDTFDCTPLQFVSMLLAIRRRGMGFEETHMGRVLQGRLLTERDFQGSDVPPSRS